MTPFKSRDCALDLRENAEERIRELRGAAVYIRLFWLSHSSRDRCSIKDWTKFRPIPKSSQGWKQISYI